MSGIENYKYGPVTKENRFGPAEISATQVLKWVTRWGRKIRASAAAQLFSTLPHH
ncbi:hypothetical protein ACIOC2_27615 [Streptomyces sp. NPDC088337]|uniref:hypothetical protein n=1 Tax=unclassified Streptomyces TaxID=2593676 RepID=UPI002DD820A5|nr:hypothetical protein [Streptomyces sp. NBC_01788]WSB29572.1 hypothetical protein OIE49_28810 [Streptomyces sp. NBC_01788]